MKKLFEFTVNKVQEIEVPEVSQDADGNTVTVLKKDKKEVPYKFFIRRPNRAMADEANLFYGARVAEGIKAGLMTVNMLEKRNISDGGALAATEKEEYDSLLKEGVALEEKFQKIKLKPESEQSPEEKESLEKTVVKLGEIRAKLQRYETIKQAVYESTAEYRARNLSITWWLVFSAYQETEPNKFTPVFGEGPYDKKITQYDELTETEDPFWIEVISRFLTYVSLWRLNNVTEKEDFERFEKIIKEDK